MTNRDEYINGLRQLADWLEANPKAGVPTYAADINLPLMSNATVEEHAAATGLEAVYDKSGNASATVRFGPVTYYAYGYADWDQHLARQQEKQARTWADKNGMDIVPADGGEAV